MIIWVFAGGGYTELGGLTTFLERNFPPHTFVLKTPVRPKPGPKPNRPEAFRALGQTGQQLARQINEFFQYIPPNEVCDILLIVDDLDCAPAQERIDLFLREVSPSDGYAAAPRLICLAQPEIEAWLIADWPNTFAQDWEFSSYEVSLRRAIADGYRLANRRRRRDPLSNPEQFSEFNNETGVCRDKLSDTLQKAVFETVEIRYSKANHSARLLQQAQAAYIASHCPIFRRFYSQMRRALEQPR
jgi:hypothetical protein